MRTQKILKSRVGNAINKNTKVKANISGKSIDKLTSGKALHKSITNGFTSEEHFKAVEKIKTIYRGAKLSGIFPDRDNDLNIKNIKRYSSPYKTVLGNNSKAYITVKCYANGTNKLYSLELLK